jgi:predicted O-methyltransferase YrrM
VRLHGKLGHLKLKSLKHFIKSLPFIRRVIQIYIRRRRAVGSLQYKLRIAKSWSYKKTEFSNYYYSLTPRNRKDLAFLISHICHEPLKNVEDYFFEIENDNLVKEILIRFRDKQPELRDSTMEIGRRIGWYALIRIRKPKFVVETGVHHGVGALVINSALHRNRKEGYHGEYLGTDINPNSGELIIHPFNEQCSVVIDDSIATLQSLVIPIDLFINDSDHSAEYEAAEYSSIEKKLSMDAMILGDNSHASDSLRRFSEKTNRHFIFFKEEPFNHFYSGAGIGISFKL